MSIESIEAPRADLLMLLMRSASALAEQINVAVVSAGHPALRPAHGLVFARAAGAGATISEIAAYLGVAKQSAAAIVDELVSAGYLSKQPHPRDRRSQLVRLTEKGVGVTETATAESLSQWNALSEKLGSQTMAAMIRALEEIGHDGSPRPVW